VGSREQEQQQIERILEGDEQAFADLVEAHYSALIRLAMSFVRSRNVAEEVVQETWMAALAGLPRFEGRSSLKTWIFRILINRAKTRGVKEARSVPFSSMSEEDSEPAVEPQRFQSDGHWTAPVEDWGDLDPGQLLLQKELRERMEDAIGALPANQRAVVSLRDLEGWSSEEVCNVLEISETNQRVLLHRGRSKVRKTLERYLKKR
jgi:RNA polymerase sigma-70 factor (ECF subfamily)